MRAQFIRIHAYSNRDSSRLLAEANREPDFCSHVEKPLEPSWWVGSKQSVATAIETQMRRPATVRLPDGTIGQRRQRSDHRCLVAGVISWPDSFKWFAENKGTSAVTERAAQLEKCLNDSIRWLDDRFGEAFVAAVVHRDEEYPHMHYYCVGDANKLHPGLRAEFVNGQRLKSKRDKQEKHKQALTHFLDDYYECVGRHVGLERHADGPRRPRIKDRAVAMRVLPLEKRMKEIGDVEGLAELSALAISLNNSRVPLRF